MHVEDHDPTLVVASSSMRAIQAQISSLAQTTAPILIQGETGVDKHTHFIIYFAEGGGLLFRDVRTFGKIVALPDGNWQQHPRITLLGPEPLDLKIKPFLNDKSST